MAYLLGLICWLFVSIAFADYPATAMPKWFTSPSYGQYWCSATAAEACSNAGIPPASCSAPYVQLAGNCGNYSCPNGGTLSGTICIAPICPPGQTNHAPSGVCSIDCSTVKGKSVTELRASSYSLNYVDSTGCQLQFVSGNTCTYSDGSSCFRVQKAVYTGQTSTSSADAAALSASASSSTSQTCPVGQCPGTFNGVNTCLSCTATGGVSAVAGAKTQINPDGTKTQVNTTYNQSGDTITTTTITTQINSSGVPGTSTTDIKTQDQKSFCEQNGNLSICRESTFGSTDCSAQPVCTGDAIQCAIAGQLWQSRCARSALNDVYDAATSDAGKASDSASLSTATTDLSTGISTTRHLSSACVSDYPITVMGRTTTLPISNICPYINILGNIMVVLSMYAAYLIVGRG